jgi:hypothetical protein
MERTRKGKKEDRSLAGERNQGQIGLTAKGGRENEETVGIGKEVDVLIGTFISEEPSASLEVKLW